MLRFFDLLIFVISPASFQTVKKPKKLPENQPFITVQPFKTQKTTPNNRCISNFHDYTGLNFSRGTSEAILTLERYVRTISTGPHFL